MSAIDVCHNHGVFGKWPSQTPLATLRLSPVATHTGRRKLPTGVPRAESKANLGPTYSSQSPNFILSRQRQQREQRSEEPSLVWDDIYQGRMPLVGFEPVVARLPDPLAESLLLHTFVALGSSQRPDQCMVLDFLPERPTDPATALTLISGGSVPGRTRVRRLSGWIRGASIRTRLVSSLKQQPLSDVEAQAVVDVFNSRWDSELRLLRNDCRHYVEALLAHLSAGCPQGAVHRDEGGQQSS